MPRVHKVGYFKRDMLYLVPRQIFNSLRARHLQLRLCVGMRFKMSPPSTGFSSVAALTVTSKLSIIVNSYHYLENISDRRKVSMYCKLFFGVWGAPSNLHP
jgi:hypothetical protein